LLDGCLDHLGAGCPDRHRDWRLDPVAANEPDKSFVELRNMAIDGTIGLLHESSNVCREEFEQMWARQF
jgi:hypothetical protein